MDELGGDKLSQEEIDALLGNVDTIDIPDDEPQEDIVKDYDFAEQDRIVSGRMAGLFSINERFIRNFRTSLMNLLRKSVDVSLDEIITLRCAEYLGTLENPACINLVRMRPLSGLTVCVFNAHLVFSIVNSLFGGRTILRANLDGKEEFTQMELRIVHLVLELIFADLERAWQPIYEVKFDYVSTEINPQLVSIAAHSDVLVIKKFRIKLEDGSTGTLDLAIPYSTIEPIRNELEEGLATEYDEINEIWAAQLREEIFDASIDLSGNLTTMEMRCRDVLSLEKGQILPVELSKIVTVLAGNVPTFRAIFGESNGNCAIKIIGRVRRV